MSSEDDSSSPLPKKKYKAWVFDNSVQIPLRTLARYSGTLESPNPALEEHERVETTESFNYNNVDEESSDCGTISNSEDENLETYDEIDHSDGCDNNSVQSDNDNEEDGDGEEYEESETVEGSRNHCENIIHTEPERNRHDLNDNRNCESNIIVNDLLYKNSSTSVDETVVDLLDLYVKNKWSKVSLKETLSLFHKTLPRDNLLPRTVHHLFNYVTDSTISAFEVTKHFYCKTCLQYVGTDSANQNCNSCENQQDDIFYFFEVDICKQIKSMFEEQNLADKLNSVIADDEDVITDIRNGSEYIRVNNRENKQQYDLTLVLNTDGISLSKSSKTHCWPIMFTIAELSQYLRESFITVVGLWCDNIKPIMNIFLKPFCMKLKKCFEEGIQWTHPTTQETFTSRIIAPLIIADAPARADIHNIINFNGKYGCNVCEIKMELARNIEGERNRRIYPFVQVQNIKLRTGKRMRKQAQKVLELNVEHIKGVKGESIITTLPSLDFGTSLIPEYMHSVLLGVGKQFISLWLKKKRVNWSILGHTERINTFLLSIRPPDFFNRLPRRITESHFYKASEYYNFILYYSLPALVDVLPLKYLQHWILFCKAIFLLNHPHGF